MPYGYSQNDHRSGRYEEFETDSIVRTVIGGFQIVGARARKPGAEFWALVFVDDPGRIFPTRDEAHVVAHEAIRKRIEAGLL